MNIPSDVLYRWWLSFSKHSEVGQEVREYYLQALLEEANEPSRPASDFPVEKFVADTVPPPALTKSEKCVMPDDIKDRALALVQRYPELGALSGAWGNEVRALAREAEAAEKKWRIGVTHSWMEKKYTRVEAEELLKDARADYPSSHVEVVPADAPFVPPRADVAKAIALVRDRPSDLGYASWRLAILRALGEEP